MEAGYIPLSRKFFEHELWQEPRVFSRAEAFADLLRRTRFEANTSTILIGAQSIEIRRGEVVASIRFLAKNWGWSKNKVDKFLDYLVDNGMITKRKPYEIEKGTRKGTITRTAPTIIKLCNFDKYNPIFPKSGHKKGHESGHERDTKGTILNKDNTGNNNLPPIIPPRGDERNEDSFDSLNKSISTPTPELRGTPSHAFMKFQEWIKNNAPRVAKMEEPFTEVQFSALKRDFDLKFICDLLQAMHNHKPLLVKNRSANLTFRNWAKKEIDRRQSNSAHPFTQNCKTEFKNF